MEEERGCVFSFLDVRVTRNWALFVCVEFLRPSQSIWVMLNAVSLPNHTFPGQT